MNLLALQRQLARAVMTPLTRSERMRRTASDGHSLSAVARRIIKPNDRLTSFERLEIYNRQYWFRVLDAFSDDFPGLRAVLGDRRFDAVAHAYLTDCPSRSFTMRNLGSRLESWLRKHPEFVEKGVAAALRRHASRRQPVSSSLCQLALDMVRLEWAEVETFDSAALPPLTPASLTHSDPGRAQSRQGTGGRTLSADVNLHGKGSGDPGLQPKARSASEARPLDPSKLRLRLQPYIRLLDLRYPVDDLLLAIKHDASTNVASNAMAERQKRKKVSAVARLKPAPVYLAIHRMDNTVYFRRLEREEFAILSAAQKGRTLQQAIVTGFGSSKIPVAERAAHAAAWFRNWSSLGWFVRAERL